MEKEERKKINNFFTDTTKSLIKMNYDLSKIQSYEIIREQIKIVNEKIIKKQNLNKREKLLEKYLNNYINEFNKTF